MLKSSLLICTAIAVASAQPPSPFHSFSSSQSPSPFGQGSQGPFSSSPFGNGPPGPQSSSPFGQGPPQGRPGGGFSGFPGGRPGFPGSGYKQRPNAPSKLFSWLGSNMAKLQGLVPKVQFHSKQKPSSSPKAPQTYFSSGSPHQSLILPQIPNSIYETGSSPFGGSSGSFGPSHSGSIKHSPVNYRNPGPPPGFSSRPGPPPSYSSRPSFSSRPPSFSSGPPPSFSSGPPSNQPSYFSGSQFSSGSPFASSSGSPFASSSGSPFAPSSGSPFSSSSSSPYDSSSSSPFSASSNRYPSPSSQGVREGLEVFPSRQVSYQSQSLSQNQPGYEEAFNGLQNLYGSQSNSKPSYYDQGQGQRGPTNYEQQQQSSYSQNQQQQASNNAANYGAGFHNIEPVRVAPMFDIQNFKASSADLSEASSNSGQKQQAGNIHDTPFVDIVNQYSAHADASTAGSEQQMMNAMQGNGDLATAASSNAIRGIQILGQEEGNPVFEVVAGPNAPTYDGHPVDLSKLISMIEPGAQIDTLPQYGDANMGAASEQQPVYAEAPSSLDMESDAAMASGGLSMSGNKKLVSGLSQVDKDNINDDDDVDDDNLHASASESRPTVVKPDGTRLTDDEKLINDHFEKEVVLDDLQDNSDKGFIIVRMRPDHLTGLGNDTTRTLNIDKDHLLAIVQQLRNSANSQLGPEDLSVVDSLENPNKLTETEGVDDYESATKNETSNNTIPTSNSEGTPSTRHPNHNYNANSPKITFKDSDSDSELSPVINPIFDTVRPNIADSESVRKEVVVDNDDQVYPDDDDMFVETEGDLAASASRNVKSVAIIVTPPPYYVKIKNKYKKVNAPMSSLTSTSSPTSATITPPPPPRAGRVDDNDTKVVNESSTELINHRESNNASNSSRSSNSSIPSAPSTAASSLQVANENNDSTLPIISSVSSIINSGRAISSGASNNGTKESSSFSRKTPRYPVYRGKTSV